MLTNFVFRCISQQLHYDSIVCFRLQQLLKPCGLLLFVKHKHEFVLRTKLMDLAFPLAESFKRLEDGVCNDAQCVVEHVGNQPRKKRALQIKAGVRVHLNQIRPEFVV
jgi:hypothetical protein